LGTGTPTPEVVPIIRPIGSTLAILLAVTRTAAAQDDRWQVALDDDRYVWDIRLVRLVYDLTPLEFADRLRTVQKVLLLHPTGP